MPGLEVCFLYLVFNELNFVLNTTYDINKYCVSHVVSWVFQPSNLSLHLWVLIYVSIVFYCSIYFSLSHIIFLSITELQKSSKPLISFQNQEGELPSLPSLRLFQLIHSSHVHVSWRQCLRSHIDKLAHKHTHMHTYRHSYTGRQTCTHTYRHICWDFEVKEICKK